MTGPHRAPPITDRNHESVTVEWLIRYAHKQLAAVAVTESPSKVTRTVRRAFRQAGPTWARLVIDNYVEERTHADSFEPWVTVRLHYADPTGNTAASNLDRIKQKTPAPTGVPSNQN